MTIATQTGTNRYRARFAGKLSDAHFRLSQNLWLSSVGLGTYLGEADDATDASYQAAVRRALELGCNVIDTAANYRFQRSERAIGQALAAGLAAGELQRAEFVVSTKGGFVPFDTVAPRGQADFRRYLEETFINTGVCAWDDFVQGQHCMTPGYLAHQLAQSLRNLQLASVDIYYVHNPESQLAEVETDAFYARLRAAFEYLEQAVSEGKIAMYGTATWNGYRVPPASREHLSLERVVQTAYEVAGEQHHCRVVQLPVNLGMTEAFTHATQIMGGNKASFLDVAQDLGLTVMCSGSILQGRLAGNLPPIMQEVFPEMRTAVQRAIQFTRSTPGVTTALVGMSNVDHVSENMEIAQFAPALTNDYLRLFSAK